MYRTSNQDYNPSSLVQGEPVKHYKDIGDEIPDHHKFLKLYKNQNVASKWVQPVKLEKTHELFPSKPFPSTAETYNYPK